MSIIKSRNYANRECHLVNEFGDIVESGQMFKSFQGDLMVVTGGRAPHKPGSTGRISTDDGGEFFPSILGLRWEERL